jgi:hypothetical protein
MRRRTADKPPTPLSARAPATPVIIDAVLSRASTANAAGSGPWNGRWPRTASHIVP